MNPVYLIIIGVFALGLAEAGTNFQLKKHKEVNSRGFLLVGNIVTLVLTLVWMIIFDIPFTPLDIRTWIILIIALLLFYAANNLYFTSYKTENASTISVLMMFSIIVSTIMGKILFNEVISITQWLGISIVLVAIFMLNMPKVNMQELRKFFSPSGAKGMAILGAGLFGLALSASKLIVQDIDPHYYQLLDVLIAIPLYYAIDRRQINTQAKVFWKKPKIFWSFAKLIVLFFIFNKLKYVAFSMGIALPIADAVDNTAVFIIMLAEYFIYGVKLDRYKRRLVLTFIAFIGIVLITL